VGWLELRSWCARVRHTMRTLVRPILLLIATASFGACQPELDLPPPPDIQGRIDAFESPDGEVLSEIMGEVADRIAELYDEVGQSSFYAEVIDVVADVQEDLYTDEGDVDLGGGVTVPVPNGGVTVEFICDGWDDPQPADPDPENGVIELNMRLAGGDIAPLVWGELDNCQYPIEIGEERLNARVDGGVAAYFGERLPAGQNVKEVPEDEDPALYTLRVIFVIVGSIVIDDAEFDIDNLFEVTFVFDDEGNLSPGATAISFLIELADGTSFRYSFAADLTQELEDGIGKLTCSLEERSCAGTSRAFSW